MALSSRKPCLAYVLQPRHFQFAFFLEEGPSEILDSATGSLVQPLLEKRPSPAAESPRPFTPLFDSPAPPPLRRLPCVLLFFPLMEVPAFRRLVCNFLRRYKVFIFSPRFPRVFFFSAGSFLFFFPRDGVWFLPNELPPDFLSPRPRAVYSLSSPLPRVPTLDFIRSISPPILPCSLDRWTSLVVQAERKAFLSRTPSRC